VLIYIINFIIYSTSTPWYVFIERKETTSPFSLHNTTFKSLTLAPTYMCLFSKRLNKLILSLHLVSRFKWSIHPSLFLFDSFTAFQQFSSTSEFTFPTSIYIFTAHTPTSATISWRDVCFPVALVAQPISRFLHLTLPLCIFYLHSVCRGTEYTAEVVSYVCQSKKKKGINFKRREIHKAKIVVSDIWNALGTRYAIRIEFWSKLVILFI